MADENDRTDTEVQRRTSGGFKTIFWAIVVVLVIGIILVGTGLVRLGH